MRVARQVVQVDVAMLTCRGHAARLFCKSYKLRRTRSKRWLAGMRDGAKYRRLFMERPAVHDLEVRPCAAVARNRHSGNRTLARSFSVGGFMSLVSFDPGFEDTRLL